MSVYDVFNYFFMVYDFEFVVVLGIGNDVEVDVRMMCDVVKMICD